MAILPVRSALCLVLCWTCFGPAIQSQTAPASGAKRIYVAPFITKQGAEKFRSDVTADLRRLHSITLAPDEAHADAVLDGGGEIWIKGYRVHNPQLGHVPPNNSPVYTGFLSVELRDRNGRTLWSYLATPPRSSTDVARDLAAQITDHLATSIDRIAAADKIPPLPQASVVLKGAGATFPYPVYSKWFTNYRRESAGVEIEYEPIGSEDGIRRLLANTVDFGASDSPQAIHELAPQQEGAYLFLPSVIGAVVPVVNVPGLTGDIAFTPEALAGIYLGHIKKWNDPILTRSNRGLHLPDLDIIVAHRAEGSGTSYAWTDYLSQTNPEWKREIGTSVAPKWPAGRGAIGNDGMVSLVKEVSGSIGYVEFIYALRNHLIYGKVRNRNGQFTEASLETIAAASRSAKLNRDFKASIVDAPGDRAYPICSFTWLIIPAHFQDARRNALIGFLTWMLGPGQSQAAALGYVPLPKELVAQEENAIARLR